LKTAMRATCVHLRAATMEAHATNGKLISCKLFIMPTFLLTKFFQTLQLFLSPWIWRTTLPTAPPFLHRHWLGLVQTSSAVLRQPH
jgi:hypothetical protein